MESQHQPGMRLGRRKPDRRREVLKLGHYLTGAVPAHPVSADHIGGVDPQGWNGATNFSYGTCGPCSLANSAICTWHYLKNQVLTSADEAIFDLYRRSGNPQFDPASDADDNGVDMTVMGSAAVKGGLTVQIAGGAPETITPLAFASVDVTSIDEIRAATSLCGGVLFGVNLEVAQQAQTDAGLWDYKPSKEWGGHAVFGGSYTSAAKGSDEKIITWQQPVGTTDSFLSHQAEECYVVLWKPHLESTAFQQGVDLAALAADYTELTGRPFPADVPPSPDPVPGTGDTDLDAWAPVAERWLRQRSISKAMGGATTTLLRAKGYIK
jgi:hypothetical protein